MSHVLENVTFNYLSETDVPFLEKHLISHWQKRANKISIRRLKRLDKKLLKEEI